jgi:hypothetical protein
MTNDTIDTPTFSILSIDAWADGDGGWNWNNWHSVGAFPRAMIDASPRAILQWFRESSMLSEASKGKLCIDDDGYDVVIMNRHTREPIYAIEYGSLQS